MDTQEHARTGAEPTRSVEKPGWLTRIVERVSLAAGWGLVGVVVLVCGEIVARKLFSHSFAGVDEIGGYTIAIVSVVGFALALVHGDHVRVDLFLSRMRPRLRMAVDRVADLFMAGIAVMMVYQGLGVLLETVEFQSTSTSRLQTPMWMPQSLWLFGLALFAVVAVLAAVRKPAAPHSIADTVLQTTPDASERAS